MAKLMAEAVFEWLDRAPHFRLETENESFNAKDFRDAIILRAAELGQSHPPGTRLLNPTGRGAEYWIDTVALWLAGCVPIPAPVTASLALRKAVDAAVVRPACGEAALYFTSGARGVLKGVLLTAAGILANAQASGDQLDLPSGSRLFVPMPFHCLSSLSHFLNALRSGASFIGHERSYFAGGFLREVERVGADALGCSPLAMRWALESQRPWRWLMASGDRLPAETVRAIRYRHPSARLNVVYGMTELSGPAFILAAEQPDAAVDTVGRPIAGLTARIDPVRGEVQFSGVSVMLGYEGMGQEGFTEDGWLKSGDLGGFDGAGRLRLLGRTDDIFKCAGNKVSLGVIANGLWQTGDFSDVAVVALEHATLGQVAHAYVVPVRSDWATPETLGKLRNLLPADHIPHSFSRELEIAPTGSGKLHRPSRV